MADRIDNAELLSDLDNIAQGIMRPDSLDAGNAARAIRALEAKVRAVEHTRDTYYVAKPFYNSTEKELNRALERESELRADRNRLAGEVERLTNMYGAAMDRVDGSARQVARLTAEVAELREELAQRREYMRRDITPGRPTGGEA